jgi:hypothetical protein
VQSIAAHRPGRALRQCTGFRDPDLMPEHRLGLAPPGLADRQRTSRTITMVSSNGEERIAFAKAPRPH